MNNSKYVGKSVLILGIGISGKSAIKLCKQLGFKEIFVYAESLTDEDRAFLDDQKVKLRVEKNVIENADVIIISPGFLRKQVFLKDIQKMKKEIYSELDLGYLLYPDLFYIGITGTNGKTTCSKLLYKYLMLKNIPSILGGNLGIGMYDAYNSTTHAKICIEEISAQQLKLSSLIACNISVITNITEDHITEFSTKDEYIQSKLKIFKSINEKEKYAICMKEEVAKYKFDKYFTGKLMLFSSQGNIETNGAYFERNDLVIKIEGKIVQRVNNIKLKIRRDFYDVALIISIISFLVLTDLDSETLLKTLKSGEFELENRLEVIGNIGSIQFINDSKATNPESVCFAMKSYPKSCFICGSNNEKKSNYECLVNSAIQNKCPLILFGETSNIIKEICIQKEYMNVWIVDNLQDAVDKAIQIKNIHTVVFSPGGNSKPEFSGLEERGKKFKEIVERKNENNN